MKGRPRSSGGGSTTLGSTTFCILGGDSDHPRLLEPSGNGNAGALRPVVHRLALLALGALCVLAGSPSSRPASLPPALAGERRVAGEPLHGRVWQTTHIMGYEFQTSTKNLRRLRALATCILGPGGRNGARRPLWLAIVVHPVRPGRGRVTKTKNLSEGTRLVSCCAIGERGAHFGTMGSRPRVSRRRGSCKDPTMSCLWGGRPTRRRHRRFGTPGGVTTAIGGVRTRRRGHANAPEPARATGLGGSAAVSEPAQGRRVLATKGGHHNPRGLPAGS